MTIDEKPKALKKAWGYAEVSRATLRISDWRVWLVKNYKGEPISEMHGARLPGNRGANKKIEFSGSSRSITIDRAYRSTMHKLRQRGLHDGKLKRKRNNEE
jgi:hypothetical protein